jgi:hypothetical protein
MMSAITRKFIALPDKLVEIKRVFAEDRIKSIKEVEKWLDTKVVIRHQGFLFFGNEVEEAEIIPNEEIKQLEPVEESLG